MPYAVSGVRRLAGPVVTVVLLAIPGCNGGDGNVANPPETVATAPAQTTTTDPYAVPAVIDVAYVNRVLTGLDAVQGEVDRIVLRTKAIPREAFDRLKAIYAPERLQFALDLLQEELRSGLTNFQADPGNKRTTVLELLTQKTTCLFARVERDYSAVGRSTIVEGRTQWVALRPKSTSQDPAMYNQTGWVFLYEGFERGFGPPPGDPCTAF